VRERKRERERVRKREGGKSRGRDEQKESVQVCDSYRFDGQESFELGDPLLAASGRVIGGEGRQR
jgi:hypothetical protein